MSNRISEKHECPWLTITETDEDGFVRSEKYHPCNCPVELFDEANFSQPKSGSVTDEEINNPEHYTIGIQTSSYIRSWGMDFHSGNIIKYVTRAPYKGKYLSDLKKARWYLEQLIAEAEDESGASF